MISVQSKINVYRQLLNKKCLEQQENILAEAKDHANEEMAAAKVKLAQEQSALEAHNVRIENRDAIKVISEAKTYAKEVALKTQKEINNDFEEQILEMTADYYGTRPYYDYLKRCIEDLSRTHLKPQRLKVSIRPEDEAVFKEEAKKLLPGFTFQFEKPEKNSYGGFSAVDQDGRINYDYTVKNLIETHRKYIGTQLKLAMDKEMRGEKA